MKNRTLVILTVLVAGLAAAACSSAQDASKAYSRAVINRGAIVPAESIRVHEYLNYYNQRFPLPGQDALGLDVRLGNTEIPAGGGPVWLQIGLQAREGQGTIRTPLNLALVLDTSGSMDSPDKMPYLKQSLMVFLRSLHPEDRVAIVTYSNDAQLLWRSQPVGAGDWISGTIEILYPDGSTNLHAGLMLGLEEVERNFDIRRNNRVILLTDGIANRGVTDPERIARDALHFNEKEIYLSTIGLGLDFNDKLLTTLAQQGRGAYHFVDSAQEMDKIFRKEVEGLVEQVANDVQISVEPAAGVQLEKITGFEGRPPARGAQVAMQDMGAGDSQVLMVQLHTDPGSVGSTNVAQVTLTYFDITAQRPRQVTQSVSGHASNLAGNDPLADIEVMRNATIVESAEALIAIDELFDRGLYEQAYFMAQHMEQNLRWAASISGDVQLVEDADLFARYQVTLSNALGYDPASPSEEYQPSRWGATQEAPLPTLSLDE